MNKDLLKYIMVQIVLQIILIAAGLFLFLQVVVFMLGSVQWAYHFWQDVFDLNEYARGYCME